MRHLLSFAVLGWLWLPTTQELAGTRCDTFRDCDNLGRAARDAGDLATAKAYYSQACFMEAADPLLGLRDNACRQVTTISGESDDYASAYTFFDQACTDGQDAGCFHLALLEKDRGNLETAMRIMEPLCHKDYIIHENIATSGCREYEQMEREWAIQNPREPRANAIQIAVFAFFFLLSFMAIGFSVFKRYSNSLILSTLAFATYAYYESGVSPYAAIRIDLLLILPMLFVNLILFVRNLFGWFKNKPAQGG
jgi:hypothetical protein